jgi:TolA-binding protein
LGNKSGWTGKYILYYLAVSYLIAGVTIVACAPVQDKVTAIRAHQQLEQYRENMAAGFFDTVIDQCNQIIDKDETVPPADIALYALGEVYANQNFSGRNYSLAQHYFEKLVENFPDSVLVPEAKIFISLFETIAAREQALAVTDKNNAETKKKSAREQALTVIDENNAGTKKKSVSAIKPRKLIVNQDFEEAVKKNLQVVDESGKKKPADEALYNLGLIYVHYDNPAKDYQKSQLYFQQLSEQFPESEFAEEAQIWLGLFETIEKMQQIDKEIEQQKKQLNE